MPDTSLPTRRFFLAGVATTALMPGSGLAQTGVPGFARFAAHCRALSGFDTIARPLLRDVGGMLIDPDRDALISGSSTARDVRETTAREVRETTAREVRETTAREVQKTVLKALYTGRYTGRDGTQRRLGYSDALMYAAIEETVNVPGYCGGVPGYWAEKPAGAL